jgi:hypothetical protein
LPPVGYYGSGANIDIVGVFSEKVDVTGSPRIELTVGGSTKYATYSSGTGTSLLTFRYTVGSSDIDLNGIEIATNNIQLNSGTIKDAATSTVSTITFTKTNFNLLGIVVDGVARTVSGVATSSSGNIVTAAVLPVTVTFNQAVLVDTTGGTPRVPLFKTNGSTLIGYANYVSGSGTAALLFRYTVLSTDSVPTNTKAGTSGGSGVDLNGGTIKDYDYPSNNNATVTFSQTTLSVTMNQ